MEVSGYLSGLPSDRRDLLAAFHDMIVVNDASVSPFFRAMMGKEMILYE
jgi:hypothetical protein